MSEPTAEENDAVFVDEDEMDEELAIKDDSGAVPSDTEVGAAADGDNDDDDDDDNDDADDGKARADDDDDNDGDDGDDDDDYDENEEREDIEPLCHDERLTFAAHTDSVYCIATNPVFEDVVVSGGGDDRAFLWSAADGMLARELVCLIRCFRYTSRCVALNCRAHSAVIRLFC